MPTIANKDLPKNKQSKHTLDRKFATVEEAADVKTGYVGDAVLTNVDGVKLEERRTNQQAGQ